MKTAHDICSSYDWIDTYSFNGDIHSVLSHNDEPTSLQTTSLASSKEHIDRSHHRITQDINTLEHALHSLCARRQALNRLSVRHAGALSTFRRLPNEILLEIFLHVCGNKSLTIDFQEEGPWTLRAVCRKWATIAENCSQLWCNMKLDIDCFDDERAATFAQALQFCGSRPIQISLSVNGYDGSRDNAMVVALDTIASSSHRWDTLSVDTWYGDMPLFVLELFPRLEHKLPLLRSLNLWVKAGSDFDSDPSTTTTALLTAPLLENLTIELPEPTLFGQLLDVLPLPCQQIRQLSCILNEPGRAVRHVPLFLLQGKFPLLEKCVFDAHEHTPRASNPVSASTRVKHEGVRHLVTEMWPEVLNAFSFPGLRTFYLGEPVDEPPVACYQPDCSATIFKCALDMLSASRCSLVSLLLPYAFRFVNEFLSILEAVPTLEILDMRVFWIDGAHDEILCDFFTALGNRRNNSKFAFLPALQDLRLSIAAQSYSLYDPGDLPLPEFRCVSKVFGAITERCKYPSDFREFSFRMVTNDKSRWFLSDSDVDRLLGLESTKLLLEAERFKTREQKEQHLTEMERACRI